MYLQKISFRFIEFLIEDSIVLERELSYRSHVRVGINMELQNFLDKIWSLREHEALLGVSGEEKEDAQKKTEAFLIHTHTNQQKTPKKQTTTHNFYICIFSFFIVCLKY